MLLDRDGALAALDRLIERGAEIHDTLAADPRTDSAVAPVRAWQRDCEALITGLAGGSKAHWLARAYSDALLVRSATGRAVEEADPSEIVDRIVAVLDQAVASLSQVTSDESAARSGAPAGQPRWGPRSGPPAASPSPETPRPRRLGFVENAELREVLELALADSRAALEWEEFGRALVLSCSVLEAIVTDALERRDGPATGGERGRPRPAGWSFEERIEAAERAGLIGKGCARLSPVARRYRDLADADGVLRPDVTVSEHDARLAAQVLQIVLRDLDPGR